MTSNNNHKKEITSDHKDIVSKMFGDDNTSAKTTNETQMQHNATQCNTKKENCFLCKYCGKEFNKHQSYYRHMKYYCKSKKNEKYQESLTGMFQQLMQSKDDLINCQKENLQLLLEEKDKRIEENKMFLDI